MSFSGFPTGFSLDPAIASFGAGVSAYAPTGEITVGDFAPMDTGYYRSAAPVAFGTEEPTGLARFLGDIGSIAGGVANVATGIDDVVRAAKGMPPRVRYADGSRRYAGEGMGEFFERHRSMAEGARSAFQPSRPVQTEASNVERDLQIVLPQRMASVFAPDSGFGGDSFSRNLPADITSRIPRFR